jgi:ATP-dependent protease HslVU (ClpYQ) peptidase subunit
MTVIVGVVHKDSVFMGCDSAVTYGRSHRAILADSDAKVFVRDDFIFGFCGSGRDAQIIKYHLSLPMRNEKSVDEYLHTDFIESFRYCISQHGSGRSYSGQEFSDTSWIVGYYGKIYRVDCDFVLMESSEPFICRGSGESIATGVMYATENSSQSPRERIRTALEASEKYNPYVYRPFHILQLPVASEEGNSPDISAPSIDDTLKKYIMYT